MMEALWGKLYELYRDKANVLGEIGGIEYQIWSRYLATIQPEQIAHGLEKLLDRESEWPPHIQEFYRLCREKPAQALHQEYIGLPILKATRESWGKCRNKLREILRGS